MSFFCAAFENTYSNNFQAREREMAICCGRPCVIDDDYCNVRAPKLSDFPARQLREAHLFVHWVRLSTIVGDVNRKLHQSRRSGVELPSVEIASQLIAWIQSLPSNIQLSIREERTTAFDRDVHLLHIPYLALITLIYLKYSEEALPAASVAAVLAATCTARIFEDLLVRGSLNFMSGESGWYLTIAVHALVHVLPLDSLSRHAAQHIHVLRSALKHLASANYTARAFEKRLDRLIKPQAFVSPSSNRQPRLTGSQPATLVVQPNAGPRGRPSGLGDLCAGDSVHWLDFFPFATAETSPLVAVIFEECKSDFPQLWYPADLDFRLEDFWDDFAWCSGD